MKSTIKSNSRHFISQRVLINRSGSQNKYDLAVVGHIVIDYISRGSKQYAPQMGSPCVYTSLGARALNGSVFVASKVGHDFGSDRLDWLRKRGVNVDHVRQSNSPTTSYKIKYVDGRRLMWLGSRCASLTRRDLSALPASSALHFGPILNEIPQSLAISLTHRNSVTCLDPQGYLRRVLRDGRVSRSKWRNQTLLKRLDVLKVAEDEASVMIGRTQSSLKFQKLGPEIILITKGKTGTMVWSKDDGIFTVPAYKTRVNDPTGAGDALVGAFLVNLVRTGDLAWSVAKGSAVASFVVEKKFGLSNFGTPKQVEERARKIFDGIIKLHG